jgi:ABC-type branched-subunit amino acid transport system ATPase component
MISAGTERMLVDFGKANWVDKALQQPDKVRMVLEKARTDGIAATVDAVRSKLDEPLEGLAPVIVEDLLAAIRRLVRDEGMAAIIVEQHAHQVLPIADQAVILDRGSIIHGSAAPALLAQPDLLSRHLGLQHH